MEFKTLKKSHKKQIIIGVLAICVIGGALTFATTRAKYKVTQNLKLAKGTVNYKSYDFKSMAMYQENDSGTYTEITGRMPSTGYVINESKSYCTLDNKNKDTEAILKTINGDHVISNLKKSDKCYIWFDKKPITIPEIIAANNPKTTTPDFSQVATTDEGVYSVSDGMYGGTSYYWRGAVTNNYVKFANKCWRIIRINGDGSLRLIYDGTTCHTNATSTTNSIAKTNIQYNSNSNNSSHVGWTYTAGNQRPANNATATASNAKTQTESWFNSNVTGPDLEKVANGKFCNDRSVGQGTFSATGTAFYYGAYTRIITNRQPSLSCSSGDVYEIKVGAITADEVMYAGGLNANNTTYYLYNGQNYWTMSPYQWYSGSSSYAYVFYVDGSGYLSYYHVSSNTTRGLRPVINLKADTTFATGGSGTQSNPYVVQ